MNIEFRLVGPDDERVLIDLFSDIDETFFRPHPFTAAEAQRVANYVGRDAYAILADGTRPIAYGILRGWDDGYSVPSLGIAVRSDCRGRGLGRLMMAHLHAEARRRGAIQVRLRVHPENVRARRLCESLGYVDAGEDGGELAMLLDIESAPGQDPALDSASTTLRAELLGVEDPRWASFLQETPHDFYHLPAYAALCARQEAGEPRALLVEGRGGCMLLPLIIRGIPGSDRTDATSPYGYPGPLVGGTADPTFLREALVVGVTALQGAGVVSAFVRLHPLLNPWPLEGIGTVVEHGQTVSIDLALPQDTLWAQMRLNHRRDIRRALQLGYVTRMDDSFDAYRSFRRLYRLTMERRAASRYYFFDDAYFDGLRDALGGRLHLCVVEKGGAIAAAGLFVETDGIVQYHLSGTDDAFADMQPTKLMMHHVGGWAKQRGNRCLHLGGGVGGTNDSLFRFKEGFSPLRHPFRTMRVVVDEPGYRRLVAARDPVLETEEGDGFFPTYRRDAEAAR